MRKENLSLQKLVLFVIIGIILTLFVACDLENKGKRDYMTKESKELEQIKKWKNEILETEKQFATLVAEKGVEEAFLSYAAEDAVLLRENKLIKGKTEIKELFKSKRDNANKVSLTWEPDFVDVSSSGDLAYTYGKYTYSVEEENGEINSSTGVFHTVWKRQEDGCWRFVWD